MGFCHRECEKEEGDKKDVDDDGDVSDDDVVEDGGDGMWLGMGMTRKEKIETRRPLRNSLITKLVERSIGYQYLYRRIQAM